MGIDTARPRLSWQLRSDRRGAKQTAYRILVAGSAWLLATGTADVWDSGRVESEKCVLVPYGGPPLSSRQRLHWTVQVWDELDELSTPLTPAHWEVGLLEPADWQAEWIAPARPAGPSGVSYLRTTLRLDATVRSARAYVTALGLYTLSCNGRRLGDARFTPGWTDYAQRVQYQVLDLTDVLRRGDNEIEVVLVDGWYAGYIGFLGQRGHYGDTPQLLAQIEVETADGRVLHPTGSDWLAGTGPLVSSDMLMGERYDFRTPATAAEPVRITKGTSAIRVCSPAPPVRVTDELAPLTVERVGLDTHRIDFGQNLVGGVRLQLAGAADTTVTVRHGELLTPDGSLYVENLRAAAATDTYVLDGLPRKVEPLFTFHGFRYAEVSGYPHELRPADVTALVIGSDVEPVGQFACSDARVNRLHANISWGARSNFLDIPTDCPQRDERMGWTGDAQVFAPTACHLFDTAGFFTKWLRDLTDAQTTAGSFPDVAPLVVLAPEGSAGWADAGVIVPWVVWETYADREQLTQLYPAMRRWVDYVHRANPGLLWVDARGYDNGDWLAAHADTDKDLIATAYFARSARLTARAAEVLGHSADAAQLHGLADRITDAFRAAFLLPDGRLTCETQTAYALALRFDLVSADLVTAAGQRLVDDIEQHGIHLTTGFLGVGQLLPALTDIGRSDLAYRLLLQDDYPSWLYAVRAGATTIWERWDGWTAEAGPGDPAMNSYNHYALGSVGEWLYRTVAGIDYASPGGRALRLAPTPDPMLEWASATHLSPYGPVSSGWRRQSDGTIAIEVQVPVGCTANVVLGAANPVRVDSGRHTFTYVEDVLVSASSSTPMPQ
jgi:alpha-L-rhamnosidase